MTKKYVFKNPVIESAFQVIAEQLRINDFDEQVKSEAILARPFKNIYGKHSKKLLISFSVDLLEVVEVFDPNGWNNEKVTPPKVFHDEWSKPYLVETMKGHFVKGVFDFEKKVWLDIENNVVIPRRFREMPDDFFAE